MGEQESPLNNSRLLINNKNKMWGAFPSPSWAAVSSGRGQTAGPRRARTYSLARLATFFSPLCPLSVYSRAEKAPFLPRKHYPGMRRASSRNESLGSREISRVLLRRHDLRGWAGHIHRLRGEQVPHGWGHECLWREADDVFFIIFLAGSGGEKRVSALVSLLPEEHLLDADADAQ